MTDERLRPGLSESRTDGPVDVPVARAQAGAAGGATYSEKQVAEILQRAAQLERGRAQQKPELSLAEVEEIAREAGLDPSLVRIAAQSLQSVERERGPAARFLGAPTRRTFEHVIDGEISLQDHERLGADLRAAIRDLRPMQPAQFTSLGRTLSLSARTSSGLVDIEISPRNGKTLVRIEVSCGQMAGGFFGGLMGGLGGGMMPAVIALSANAHAGVAMTAVAAGSMVGCAYGLARGLFTWRANAQYRAMEKLADRLAARLRDELASRKP